MFPVILAESADPADPDSPALRAISDPIDASFHKNLLALLEAFLSFLAILPMPFPTTRFAISPILLILPILSILSVLHCQKR